MAVPKITETRCRDAMQLAGKTGHTRNAQASPSLNRPTLLEMSAFVICQGLGAKKKLEQHHLEEGLTKGPRLFIARI